MHPHCLCAHAVLEASSLPRLHCLRNTLVADDMTARMRGGAAICASLICEGSASIVQRFESNTENKNLIQYYRDR